MNDLFTHLADKYSEARDLQEDATLHELFKDFIDFAHYELNKNPPLNIAYVAKGIGLRLADGSILALVPQTGVAPDPGKNPVYHIGYNHDTPDKSTKAQNVIQV